MELGNLSFLHLICSVYFVMYLHGETLVSLPLQEMNVKQCLVQQQ